MKQITFLTIFLFYLTLSWGQEHCISNPTHRTTEMFPGFNEELEYSDYLIIYSDSIEFDGIKYNINQKVSFPFESKDDLLRTFSCQYNFSSNSENISGELIKYEMDVNIPRIGNDIQFIYFNDCGIVEHYIFVDDGLYFFRNLPAYIGEEAGILNRSEIKEEIVEYIQEIDASAIVTYIEDPLFEYVQEQVLDKEGYNVLEEIQAEYEDAYHDIYNEYSSCADVIYETVYEQILVKEGGISFDISPAQFETVMELVGIQNEHVGENFYERKTLDSLQIQLRSPYYDLANFNVISGCDEIDFYDCIQIDFELNEGRDTTVYNIYEKCADGFSSAGKYCYAKGNVPWVYEKRFYERLKVDALATELIVPNEYTTIPLIRIINKDELEDECIEYLYDSISYQKLLIPATIQATYIEPEYSFRQIKYFQDGGVIDVIDGGEEEITLISSISGGSLSLEDLITTIIHEANPCHLPALQQSLIEVGYLDVTELDNLQAFQIAVLTYQIDNNLPIGTIDSYFIEHLDVKFGY